MGIKLAVWLVVGCKIKHVRAQTPPKQVRAQIVLQFLLIRSNDIKAQAQVCEIARNSVEVLYIFTYTNYSYHTDEPVFLLSKKSFIYGCT